MINKFAVAAAAVTLAGASIALAVPADSANPTAKKAEFVRVAGCTPCKASNPCEAAHPCEANPCAASPCAAENQDHEG